VTERRPPTGDPGLAHLLARVGLLEERIRAVVARRRVDDPTPDDPFRGLYLTDEAVEKLLAGGHHDQLPDQSDRLAVVEERADAAAQAGDPPRLRVLAERFGLDDLDVDLLLLAVIPDLDSRFERLYGYLNDDVTRRRASIGLALLLADRPGTSAVARARLRPGSPLVDRALVLVEDAERPFLTRALRVPDRVAAHLLGDDRVDAQLTDLLLDVEPVGDGSRLARALSAGQRVIHVKETVAGTGAALASAALAAADRPSLVVDLATLARRPDAAELTPVLAREVLLRGAGLIGLGLDALAETSTEVLRRLCAIPVPLVLVGGSTWDPTWSTEVPLQTDAIAPTLAERTALWDRALIELTSDGAPGLVPDAVTAQFVLGPAQVARAVASAKAWATLGDGTVGADELRRGARAQNAAGLERLARRVEPQVGWSEIVLPDTVLRQLRELSARARHRDRVLREWRMRPGGGRGRGITALFAGDSGTGKTMAAEVIAADLGLDLYTVNLATVVDKYVGETEKNLERIFSEAGGVNAVLLFDEADAIFGKRGEVRDAHDRYANMESAYLLQRMETFDGLAVLSTNLRSNIDEAFTRRLDTIVDFPAPDEAARLSLWQRCLAPPLPVADDLDLDFCAKAFTLSGGNIRSVALTAAYLAAGSGAPIGMSELIAAVQQEYRKLGRLVLEREFGPYLVRNGSIPQYR
jgi:hypothetical protein